MVLTAADRWEIHELNAQYDRGVDTQDLALVMDTFAPGAVADFNVFGGGSGITEITAYFEAIFADPNAFIVGKRHDSTHNMIIEDGPTPDTATSSSVLLVFEQGQKPAFVASSFRTDEYVKVDGEWRFSRRDLIPDPGFLEFGDTINESENIIGTFGDDNIDGELGDDTIRGLAGNDSLEGGRANDILHGDPGDDTLHGGKGLDTLIGGQGVDIISGEMETDIFVIKSHANIVGLHHDVILDFDVTEDVLALDNIDINDISTFSANNEFVANTEVRLTSTNELLAFLQNVDSSSLTFANFIDY